MSDRPTPDTDAAEFYYDGPRPRKRLGGCFAKKCKKRPKNELPAMQDKA